jgi:hypothetical protein
LSKVSTMVFSRSIGIRPSDRMTLSCLISRTQLHFATQGH